MTNTAWKSLNFEDRRGGVKTPSMIILHYTGMRTEEEALKRLCDPSASVSCHYFIGDAGDVMQLVDDSKRAWHAGISYWAGETDINSHSIGIEIANPGHEFGYRDFTPAQIASTIKLCKRLMQKYSILPKRVLGHSDIAPRRKLDPGERFPWKKLAAEGIGVWPKTTDSDLQAGKALAGDEVEFKKRLVKFGYSPDSSFDSLVLAFHRHFYPEKMLFGDKPDKPNEISGARLIALGKL